MRRTTLLFAVLLAIALLPVAPSTVSADEAAALKYLDEAKKQIAAKDPAEKIDTKLRLVEAELAGVDAAKKEPILKEIAALRAEMKTTADDAFKKELTLSLEKRFEAAQGMLGLRNTGINKELDDLDIVLKDPKTETALGAAKVAEYKTKLTGYRAVNTQKMGEETIATMTRLVDATEKNFPEWLAALKGDSPASRDGAAQSFGRRQQEYDTLSKEVPAGNAALAELNGRMNKMKSQVDALYGNAMVAEITTRLKNNWQLGSDDFNGYEAETLPPKFADLVSTSNAANSRLGAPKTVAFISKANQFLESLRTNEQAKPYLESSPLKEYVADIRTKRDAALGKLGGFADAILAEAAAIRLNKASRDRLDAFGNDDLRLSLEGHPQLASYQDRAKQLVAVFDTAAQGRAADQEAAMRQMKSEASAAWPKLIEGLPADEKFDPADPEAYKGKLIRIRRDGNRKGYGYGVAATDTYDFATEIDGKAVAGEFSPTVRRAVEDYKAKTGQDGLPPETPYDLIARYDGGKYTLQRREDRAVKVTGDVQGELRGEVKVPVEAPLLTIVGLYCGPVAVLAPKEELESSTTIDVVANSGASVGFLPRLTAMILFLLAALAVLMKAEFAPLATIPQLAKVRDNMHARNQTVFGGILIVIALYLIYKGWFFYGLLGNLVLIASGIYLALNFFEKQSWWKPEISVTLRKLAVPLGFACAGIAIWRLLFTTFITII